MKIKSSQTLVAEALKDIKTISTDEAHDMFIKNECNLIDIRDIRELEKEGKISIKIPCQLESIEGDKNIKSITVKFDDGKTEKINTDLILSFFGLIMKLGPIAKWNLNMTKKINEPRFPIVEDNPAITCSPIKPPKLFLKYKSPIELKQINKKIELASLTRVLFIDLYGSSWKSI